jgi:hypothetical protein
MTTDAETATSVVEEIRSTDEAFVSTLSPKQFNGVTLKAFSLMRQTVSMELCGPDSSAFFEAVIRVWVCTLEPEQVLEERENRRQAQLRAFAWAEAQGVSMQNWQPLLNLYRRLTAEIDVSSQVRPETEEPADERKNSGGPPV